MRKTVSTKSVARKAGYMVGSCLLTLMTVHSAVLSASISDIPLRVASGADPNIMFIIDDSGSMHWEVTPDDYIRPYYIFPRTWSGIYGAGDYSNDVAWPHVDEGSNNARATAAALRSNTVNRTYYNPAVTYEPWIKADGSRFSDADSEAAYHHPVRTEEGTRNLTEDLTESARWRALRADNSSEFLTGNRDETYFPARYFYHTGGEIWDVSNYEEVEIKPDNEPFVGHGREGRTDCGDLDEELEEQLPDGESSDNACSYEDEIQNFANWYTYYRSRILASQGAIGIAFSQLSNDPRVGFGTLNKGSSNVDGVNTRSIVRGVRQFKDEERDAFYEELYERVYPPSGTPLRRALQRAGEYFSRSDDRGPWSDTPGEVGGGPHLECRQSYTILMTDGFWNGGSPDLGNVDNTAGSTITGPDDQSFTYEPTAPFADSFSNTLADVAMYYWKNNLREDLANRVPVAEESINPAFWQHMVTFGVGLAVEGDINPDDAFDAIEDDSIEIDWPDPTTSNAAKIDDLLHASINGRGGFFTTDNPVTFGEELAGVLGTIIDRAEASSTAAAASSAVLNDDADRFVASFRGSDWSGELISENIVAGTQNWSAQEKLSDLTDEGTELDNRNLFSHDGSSGISMKDFFNFSGTQRSALNRDLDGENDGFGEERLRWLRGAVDADEDIDEDFRSRIVGEEGEVRLLGDIVNSSPQIDRKINFGFGRIPDGNYRGFRSSTAYTERPRALYVGSNAGYLHAFDAESGEELFAYMPGGLLEPEDGANGFAKVNRLMDRDYTHRFYVDGTPTISDAFVDGEWKTVLVGSMGAGGDRVFALDVTSPQNFSEEDVLWEFDHADLNRGVTRVQVGRLATGEWAAIFGSGLEGDGKLFVVDMDDGSVETLDAGGAGLSTPVLTATDGIVDFAYAGDLDGGLWRFDLSSDNDNQWGSERLFTAEDPDGDAQPITARPRVAPHPDRQGVNVVAFGTGAFFRDGDRGDSQTQSLYGIFDDGESSDLERENLQMQEILGEEGRTVDVEQDDGSTQPTDFTIRRVSENNVPADRDGWYLDLDSGVSGERVLSQATFPSGLERTRVRFTTLVPDDDPCGPSVDGWLMELDLASGGRVNEAVFDLERDGEFHDEEISGVRGVLHGEELTTIRDGERDQVVDPATDEPAPDLKGGDLGVGRQSWEQLR